MRTDEMIEEVYSQLGKPSDLNPMDDLDENVDMASIGAQRILDWLNRGYRRVLTWRFPNGRIVRFRTMERSTYFNSVVIEGVLTAVGANTATLSAEAAPVTGRYVRWVLEVNGQRKRVVAYTDGRVATVDSGWDVVPAVGAAWRLYKSFSLYVEAGSANAAEHIALSPVNDVMSVLKVTDVADGCELQRAERISNFEVSRPVVGKPSLFQDREDGIFFDTAVDESRYYEMRYYGFPPALVAGSDMPQMPVQFHEAVLLWAVWWGLRRNQEFSGAYSTKRDLEDFMSSALAQYDMANARDDISLFIG